MDRNNGLGGSDGVTVLPLASASGVAGADAAETQVQMAAIIPFPARPRPQTAIPAESERLQRALLALNTALADQRAALKSWRGAMQELRASTASLDDSLQSYRANLRSLGSSVASLREKAKSLEQWADKALAQDQGAVR